MKPRLLDQMIAAAYGRTQPRVTVHFGLYLWSGGTMKYASVKGVA
jgi:hypothetical protein